MAFSSTERSTTFLHMRWKQNHNFDPTDFHSIRHECQHDVIKKSNLHLKTAFGIVSLITTALDF